MEEARGVACGAFASPGVSEKDPTSNKASGPRKYGLRHGMGWADAFHSRVFLLPAHNSECSGHSSRRQQEMPALQEPLYACRNESAPSGSRCSWLRYDIQRPSASSRLLSGFETDQQHDVEVCA